MQIGLKGTTSRSKQKKVTIKLFPRYAATKRCEIIQ